MRRFQYAFATLGILTSVFAVQAQIETIILDGKFEDWTTIDGIEDSVSADALPVDLLEMKVTSDSDYLYVYVRLASDIDLTDVLYPHNLFLQIDVDMDASTGYPVREGFGSELGIDFNGLFAYTNFGPADQVNFSEIGLIPSPTVTSKEFEFGLRRDVVLQGGDVLFPQDSIGLLFRDTQYDDDLPDQGASFVYDFNEANDDVLTPLSLTKGHPSFLRVCAYNVLGNGLIHPVRQSRFERIVSALDADVYLFSECGSTSSAEVKSLLDNWLPLESDAGWQTAKDGDLISATRWNHLQSWTSIPKQYPLLVNVPDSLGGPMLFINSHLSCCGNDASRQDQVDEMMAWMINNEGNLNINTPIVYAGDLNLVGYAQQLETLLNGDIVQTQTFGPGGLPDWDGTPWSDALPRQTHQPFTYTWRDDGDGNFPPGRLDLVLYSDAVIVKEHAFVLETESTPEDVLAPLGLIQDDTHTASDHLPVVMDFTIVPPPVLDSDGDGLDDELEIEMGTNPFGADSDGDGLTDGFEVLTSGTNPLLYDTNGNNCPDGEEMLQLCAPCPSDLNQDGIVSVTDVLFLLGQFGAVCP
ncbi:MAG: endonuclease/exonuclease/phosphatase family protein [Flavobacteriales bacterium]